MKLISFFIMLIFLVSCNREHRGKGRNNRHSIEIDDERRRFQVYTPKDYDESKIYPVMFAIHGRHGNPRNMAKMTNFNPLADEREFLVVYPRGFRRSWNDGRGEGPAADNNIDDVKFMKGIIGFLKANYPIDEDRLFVAGMSNGGFMAMRLACDVPNDFQAFISVTGSLALDFHCAPESPVNILLFAGTDDELVPYEGGEVASSESFSMGFEDLLDLWRDLNSCSNFESKKLPKISGDETEVVKLIYKNCEAGKKTMLYKIIKGGHTWSMGNNFFGENTTGINSKEINASETIVDFCLEL